MNVRSLKALALGTVLTLLAMLASSLINSALIHPRYLDRQHSALWEIEERLLDGEDPAIVQSLEPRFDVRFDPSAEPPGEEWTSAAERWPSGPFDIHTDGLELPDGTLLQIGMAVNDPHYTLPGKLIEWCLQCLAIAVALGFLHALTRDAVRDVEVSSARLLGPRRRLRADPVRALRESSARLREELRQRAIRHEQTLVDQETMLTGVAHEFRSPLARLRFANEMAATEDGDAQRRLLEEAGSAAERLDELVREILGCSRLGNEEFALHRRAVSLSSVLEEISAFDAFPERKLSLVVEYPATDAVLWADGRLLHRALTNLVANAQRHARSRVTVRVAGRREGRVCIRILDDGSGVPEAQAEQIFQPFFRLEASRSRDSGGFGLGLTIVRSIVEKHGGRVRLVGVDRGCCFEVQWPLHDPRDRSGEHRHEGTPS